MNFDWQPVKIVQQRVSMVHFSPSEDSTSSIILSPLKFVYLWIREFSEQRVAVIQQDNTESRHELLVAETDRKADVTNHMKLKEPSHFIFFVYFFYPQEYLVSQHYEESVVGISTQHMCAEKREFVEIRLVPKITYASWQWLNKPELE